ncbi:MAG: hypothetical protein GZ086_02625 [Gelidibacter sp.]|nr:hypothetical protein [Gelidibacter sp.]
MKKYLFLFAALIVATSASAQFYVSASGGAQIGSAGFLMGTELNAAGTTATNEYGSFGEGLNAQLRAGYFWNKTFGVEVGLGYLHGADQVKDSQKTYLTMVPALGGATASVKDNTVAKAYGRAYGASVALVYNFNEHIYGKFGVVTKVGGKTVAEATNVVKVTLAENVYAPAPAPTGTVAIPAGTPLKTVTTNLEQEFHGRIPIGFIGAMGYKHKLTDNLNLFAELEYLGINVTRDNSEYTKFTSVDVSGLGAPTTTTTLDQLPVSMKEFEYVDSLPVPYVNTDTTKPTKVLSEVVPYSSFGVNFGITYTFSKKAAK